jgi:hypothetical protein
VEKPEEQHWSKGVPTAARVPLLILLICLAAVGVARVGMEMEHGIAIDFYQFWALSGAPEELPGESVYALDTDKRLARIFFDRAEETKSSARQAAARLRAQRLGAISTPLLYSCFRAFRTGDYDIDLRRYRLTSLMAFVLATLLVGYIVGCKPATILGALAFFLWAFPPLRFDLSEGNVNAVQFAVLALVLWLRCDPERAWRTVAAGCVLSLGVLFKPNLAMVAALLVLGWGFLGRGRDVVRATIGAALGIAIGVAASTWLLGPAATWGDWIGALRHLDRDFAVGVAHGNFGGAKLIGEGLGWDPTVLLLIVLVGIVAGKLWKLRRAVGGALSAVLLVRDVDALLITIGPAVAILGTTIAWPHYAVLCVPLCLVCMHHLESEVHLVCMPGLILLAALAGLSSAAGLEAGDIQNPFAKAIALSLGVMSLYVGGVVELGRRSDAERIPTSGSKILSGEKDTASFSPKD